MTATVAAAATAIEPAPEVAGMLRRWRSTGMWAAAVWLALFAGWAGLAPISGAVVGAGQVKVQANRQTVSHRDGGIVARVLVQEGQVVAKGQPLVLLEDARIDSTVDLLQAQLVAETLRKSRLEAESALSESWQPPAALADAGAARAREAIARERAAFDARRRSLLGQLQSSRAQMEDADAEMKAHARNHAASAEALRLLRDEIASNETLLQENFVNRARVLQLRRGLAEYESRIEASQAELLQARQRRAELEGRLTTLRLAYAQNAAEELRESTARAVDLEERLRAGRDTAGRQVVAAPVAGRLVDLKVNTVGSAIGPREPIVDIVPDDQPLVVETRVAADAVTELRAGQVAEIKLLGARQRETGLIEGRVTRVSADALMEPRSGAPYFAVMIEVAPAALAAAGAPALAPGLATEVYIRTSQRTPIEFLMEPLTAGLRRGFREH